MLAMPFTTAKPERFAQDAGLARTLAQLATSCRLAAQELGFEHFLLLARFPDAPDAPHQVILSGLPPEWERLYNHHRWIAIDPILARALTTTVPFTSEELDWDSSQHPMRCAASLHGLDHAAVVPLRGPRGEAGFMSFVRHTPIPHEARERNAVLGLAQLYAHRIYAWLIDHVRASVPRSALQGSELSLCEREVLSLAALGDRIKVIASRVGITPRAAAGVLRRATEKVGASTLPEAILKAAMRGELQWSRRADRLQDLTVFLHDPAARPPVAQ